MVEVIPSSCSCETKSKNKKFTQEYRRRIRDADIVQSTLQSNVLLLLLCSYILYIIHEQLENKQIKNVCTNVLSI